MIVKSEYLFELDLWTVIFHLACHHLYKLVELDLA